MSRTLRNALVAGGVLVTTLTGTVLLTRNVPEPVAISRDAGLVTSEPQFLCPDGTRSWVLENCQ